MAWVRLADDFYDHPKVLSAGAPAAWLWICGLAYANRYLTDGFVPAAAVRRLTDLDDPFRLAAKLVDVGLFEAVDGGYRIHDYAEYQPSAGDVKDQRQKTADRVAAWRDRHRNGVTAPSGNGVGNARTNAAPGPDPDPAVNPDPAGSTSPLPPPPQAEEGERRSTRRRKTSGMAAYEPAAASPPEVPPLAPLAPADVELWWRSRERLRADMSPANWNQLVEPLTPLGRDEQGGLWLRAPPEQGVAGRVATVVKRALISEGDDAGSMARIVEQ
jgi:hypothetical protein